MSTKNPIIQFGKFLFHPSMIIPVVLGAIGFAVGSEGFAELKCDFNILNHAYDENLGGFVAADGSFHPFSSIISDPEIFSPVLQHSAEYIAGVTTMVAGFQGFRKHYAHTFN